MWKRRGITMRTLGSCRHDVPRPRVCRVLVPSAETAGLEQVLTHPSLAHVAWLYRILTKLGWNRYWSTQNLAHVACLYRILTKGNRFCTTQVSLMWRACAEYWQSWAGRGFVPPKSHSRRVLVPSAETAGLEQVMKHPSLAHVACLCQPNIGKAGLEQVLYQPSLPQCV